MNRTLNVDRMRRYVARTTPSTISVESNGDDEAAVREQIEHWGRRMVTKHNDPRPNIEMRWWDDPSTMRRKVEGKVVPHSY